MSLDIKSAIVHLFRGDNITSISPKDLAETLSDRYNIRKRELVDFLDNELPEYYSGSVRLDGQWIILDMPERNISHRIPL